MCNTHEKTRSFGAGFGASASRFGAERVRKWADSARKRVFCAAMCTGKDTEESRQNACKKREKWKGKNRDFLMSLGKNVANSGFRTMGGVGGWIFPSRLRREGGAESSRLSSFVFSLK